MTFYNSACFIIDEGHGRNAPYPVTASNRAKDDEDVSRPLREKNKNACGSSAADRKEQRKHGKYIHVPHRNKPPQVVAKRNARERRRVQAVNSAFVRLRKAVPFENHRGKRVSKVKTLQYAIDYIHQLQTMLNDYNFNYQNDHPSWDFNNQLYNQASNDSNYYQDVSPFNPNY